MPTSPPNLSPDATSSGLSFPETERWKTWEGGREKLFERLLAPYRGQPAKFLEIGSYEGASAIWMLKNILTHPDARITCVDDNSLGRKGQMLANLKKAGEESRVTLH
jgi:predicted O-methyltransferase YrrM